MRQPPNNTSLTTAERKQQHISVCANENVETGDNFTGFSDVALLPCTLPELNWSDIDVRMRFLQHQFNAPLMIAGMTFGIEEGDKINRRLATCAASAGIPMGIGSQRVALEDQQPQKYRDLKRNNPTLYLIANLGSSHLQRDRCLQAVEMVEADALAIHLNILQELVQAGGNRNFAGTLQNLATVALDFPVPIIVKEVGSGIDVQTAKRLHACGVAAIDVGGKGGTAWGWVEGLCAEERARVATTFRDWGIPTAFNTLVVRQALPTAELIATGGIRTGLDIAKALALGANCGGVGLPLLRAALVSTAAVAAVIETYIEELKMAMLATGSRTLDQLPQALCYKHPYYDEFQRLLRKGAHIAQADNC
ncbi:MAG: type 2 isopentenyl-diphosphate Delta-isomerase [Pseudomonadota bacterium]|nr:type 2 isopentenyl-diphosphate Delta-isomerase [Pseudomonadota bacterium]